MVCCVLAACGVLLWCDVVWCSFIGFVSVCCLAVVISFMFVLLFILIYLCLAVVLSLSLNVCFYRYVEIAVSVCVVYVAGEALCGGVAAVMLCWWYRFGGGFVVGCLYWSTVVAVVGAGFVVAGHLSCGCFVVV